ncbi:ADP-ribosylglycohydrolase family protein [Cytobacillus firmus]|uniref:ADP-ribosylglycohydrolase family protein n=1 Tax=Cytobacillus firmus TaxID=1399 RepID=UPI0022283E43|nr:ADP-ribosylglycohydrolase family protein [Cytobacillus firmus]
MISENYLEKVYAGFLGMNAGIRLGAPLEPAEWTAERIQAVYGDIKGYVKDYQTFSADDDANGPLFFIRALYDDAIGREMEPQDVGRAWLNYCRENVGMIWWGGEDISSEHRAYLNLKKGIPAPRSGSAEQNGIILAEQIGGQIFIDSFGLIFPGNIEKAAEYAEKAASVSHDGNGLYGARFMAACISKAFETDSVADIITAGLGVIPAGSLYSKVVYAVIEFHRENPDDFRACLKMLHQDWGYDKYTGICHIIPNAGVCVLALLYGEGDFARTIEIATMCSWDTDCNAGNVGTIAGVLNGLEGIPLHYRKPMNDSIVASSVSGYLNIVDMPTFSKELAVLGYRLAGEEIPDDLTVKKGEVFFDFKLPGSTHGFRTSNTFKIPAIRHNGVMGDGSLEVIFDRMVEGDYGKVFYKPYYRRSDFNDEKYKPVFSPQAYSGQTVTAELYLDKWQGADIFVTPYVRDTYSKKDLFLDKVHFKEGRWNTIEFIIPGTNGSMIDEIGYRIESPSALTNRAFGALYISKFHIHGSAEYEVDFSKLEREFLSLMPFSHNGGEWKAEDRSLQCVSSGECASYTGNYYSKNVVLTAEIEPVKGTSHCLLFRAPGIQRGYLAGFDGENKVSLILNDFGYNRLITVPYNWEHGRTYTFRAECAGRTIKLYINGLCAFNYQDDSLASGMYGFGCMEKGEMLIHSFKVKASQ